MLLLLLLLLPLRGVRLGRATVRGADGVCVGAEEALGVAPSAACVDGRCARSASTRASAFRNAPVARVG